MQNIQGDLMGVAGGRGGSFGSRAEFEKFIPEVPGRIQEELHNGKLRLGDQIIYSIKQVDGKLTKMFETPDTKQISIRNISNGKLPKNQTMLLSGIYLMAGEAQAVNPGSPTDEEIMVTHFKPITADPNFAALVNGEFSMRSNSVQVVPATSMRVFANEVGLNYPVGFYKLHNPRLIHDDVTIEANIELGTILNLPPNTILYLGLYGTITTP
jgi:hypothetical protein